MNNVRNRRIHPNDREGFSLIELIVAASVMVAVMTLVTTLCIRIHRVWKEIGDHRVAVSELSNQLEHLTELDIKQLPAELEQLEVSSVLRTTLKSPTISGELRETELGPQIILQLNWTRPYTGKPVTLSGWVIGGLAEVEE